jgi:localization factor PodJL
MRRHVLSRLDDLDLDARNLAMAAARRAGLSLEEWAAAVLAEPEDRPVPGHLRPQRRTSGDLDRFIARMSRPDGRQPERRYPKSDYDTLMAAVAAENERQAQDEASRTAIALESMAAWIEQAESRLDQAGRISADQQDRIAAVLAQALASLKERLDTVERKVTSERAAPPRLEFPMDEAIKALAPVSETLVGLRSDMARLALQLEQPHPAWTPAVDGIRDEIDGLRSGLDGLATRHDIAALDATLGSLAKDLEQGPNSKDIRTLAGSVAALYEQIQLLSQEVGEELHKRIGGEIEMLKGKIDRMAQSGIDRSAVDFLSGQIADIRQDLAQRAEPQQIARLTEDVAELNRQVSEVHFNQVRKGDFAALKTSLDNVCSALYVTATSQESNQVPEQLQSLHQRLDALARRPEPEPIDLDPIKDQLALLTERMAGLSAPRPDESHALTGMMDRLSSQIQAIVDEAPSQETLMERFDRIERELQQLGPQTDTADMVRMLRAIDAKLDRAPAPPEGFEVLERQIETLADRVAQGSAEPLQKAIEEAAGHLRSLQSEAMGIAERAARAALNDIRPSLPDAGDLSALKQGFVELKALQSRADRKNQETLRAVHDALETLVAHFPAQGRGPAATPTAPSPEPLPPADRLEAAVRRLHAATLSQVEEIVPAAEAVAPYAQSDAKAPAGSEAAPASTAPSLQDARPGQMRASFIAAARRAAQMAPETSPMAAVVTAHEARKPSESENPGPGEPSPSTLLDRLRKTFENHRRPLIFSIAFLVLAAGAAQILAGGRSAQAVASATAVAVQDKTDPVDSANVPMVAERINLFQAASLAVEPPAPALPGAGRFFIDPATLGELPTDIPAALQQAALTGDAAPLYEIATRAAEGRGLERDMSLALRLFERAAQAGLPTAQERLAQFHEKGIGVARDPRQAAFWYERAAQGGNIRAMHNLASLLVAGTNGKPDYAAALRWYGEAAEAGFQDSQFNMGILLARGIGARQDLAKAFQWFSLAAAQGDANAARKRDELAGRLSAADLKTARSFVEQWRPRAPDPVANEFPVAASGQTAALDRISQNRS